MTRGAYRYQPEILLVTAEPCWLMTPYLPNKPYLPMKPCLLMDLCLLGKPCLLTKPCRLAARVPLPSR